MMASASLNVMNDLKILTGLTVPDNNIIWSDSMGMRCKKQTIKYTPMSQFHKMIYPVVKEIKNKKFIAYGNSREHVMRKYNIIKKWMFTESLLFNVIILVGTNLLKKKYTEHVYFYMMLMIPKIIFKVIQLLHPKDTLLLDHLNLKDGIAKILIMLFFKIFLITYYWYYKKRVYMVAVTMQMAQKITARSLQT